MDVDQIYLTTKIRENPCPPAGEGPLDVRARRLNAEAPPAANRRLGHGTHGLSLNMVFELSPNEVDLFGPRSRNRLTKSLSEQYSFRNHLEGHLPLISSSLATLHLGSLQKFLPFINTSTNSLKRLNLFCTAEFGCLEPFWMSYLRLPPAAKPRAPRGTPLLFSPFSK